MNDLPTRLRNLHEISPPATSVLLESAREIERLSCENDGISDSSAVRESRYYQKLWLCVVKTQSFVTDYVTL
jgi:hypothetical protein